MKKFKLLFFVVFTFCSLQAQDTPWTIVKSNLSGWYKEKVNSLWAGPSLEIKLGRIKPGTKCYPIQQREDVYNIRLDDGQIGWVYFTNLRDTREMEINHPTSLCEIKGSTSFRSGKFIDSLKVGDIVTRFGLHKEGGWYFVRTKNGRKGAVIRQYADPVAEKQIPYYDELAERNFYFKEKLDSQFLNNSDSILYKNLGEPDALNYNGDMHIWYYTNIEVYWEGLRYGGIKFITNSGAVFSDSLIGAGESYFIDGFPLFLTIKGMEALDISEDIPEIPLFQNVGEHNIFIGILIRILQIVLIVLIFSLAHFIASFITMRVASIKIFENGTIKTFGVILTIILNYLYYLFLVAHIIKDSWFLMALPILFVLIASIKMITMRINYNRCPDCHAMYSAEDRGSAEAGKTHITEQKSQMVHTGQTETDTQIIDHYTEKRWNEYSTEKEMKDFRRCRLCGYYWHVTYTETVDGHV